MLRTQSTLYCSNTSSIVRRLLFLIAALLVACSYAAQAQKTEEPEYNPALQLEALDSLHRQSVEERGDDDIEDVEGRTEWFYFQRRFPYDRIPAGARAEALRETMRMEMKMREAAGNDKGAPMPLAQAEWEGIGPINEGGRVLAIAVDPSSEIIYFGAAAGGVWRSTDFGDTWSTAFDTLSALAVGAIAIDPVNPDIVYAGTGENTVNVDSYLGDGVFKSTDGGDSWGNIGLNSVGAFSKMAVHNQQHTIVYAAAAKQNGGFYYSVDGGGSWIKSASVNQAVYDMAVNPVNNDEVFIAIGNGIMRSTDRGVTFASRSSGISSGGVVRVSIAISPSEPNILYALLARSVGGQSEHVASVYKTTNSGATWQQVKDFTENPERTGFFRDQGWYNNCLAVHPFSSNVLLAGGIDIFKTENGGGTWENTTLGYQQLNDPDAVHVDQHVIVYDQNIPGLVYIGNDGGLYSSLDNGIVWEERSREVPITQYYALEVDQRLPYRVYGGTQDNGTSGTFGSDGYNPVWKNIYGGDGFFVALDYTDTRYIYAENYNGTPIQRIDVRNPDSPELFVVDGEISGPNADPGLWSSPLVSSSIDNNLYTGRRNLWRTATAYNGRNWERLTPLDGIAGYVRISAIGLSPHDSTHIIVGGQDGTLRYTTNDGEQWGTSQGATTAYTTSIVYDPVAPSRVYATFSGFDGTNVIRSDNFGETFTDITSNLPVVPVSSIAIDPEDNTHLFVGTDAGVFASLDGGNFWFPFNKGLALSPIAGLRIHLASRSLIAATHGRSMFRVNINNPETAPVLVSPVGGEIVQTPGTLAVSWVGLVGPVRIRLSYNGGQEYTTVASDIYGNQFSLSIPLSKTDQARLIVQEMTGENRELVSGIFSLLPKTNSINNGFRNAIAEAIAIRGNVLWATVRGSDTIKKYRLPLLLPVSVESTFSILQGVEGTIRDITLGYQAIDNSLFVLTASADYSNARVFMLDTTGTLQKELTLPAQSISGISATPDGLAMIAPGNDATLYVVNPATGGVINTYMLQGAQGNKRTGLAWDDFGYAQGVESSMPTTYYVNELQRLQRQVSGEFRVANAMPLVFGTDDTLRFFGLAHHKNGGTDTGYVYYATDTDGNFYRISQDLTSDVESAGTVTGGGGSVAITGISPNPLRGRGEIRIELRTAAEIGATLYSTTGERVAELYYGHIEAGEHAIPVSLAALASGVYYVSVTTDRNERDVQSILIIR